MTAIIYFISTILLLFALAVIFSWCFTIYYGSPQKKSKNITPREFGIEYEDVTFLSKGISICGWFIPAREHTAELSNCKPTIILNHGWSRNAQRMLPYASILHAADFNILLFDARSHGDSGKDGLSSIHKFAEDLVSAVNYLSKRRDVDFTKIGVLGHSMGGASAILANARDNRIKALVSDSAFADVEKLTRRMFKLYHIPQFLFLRLICKFMEVKIGLRIDKISPGNNIGRITSPILLIHGELDELLQREPFTDLFQRSNKPTTQKWLVKDKGHSDTHLHKNYANRIVTFFKESLMCERVSQDETFAKI